MDERCSRRCTIIALALEDWFEDVWEALVAVVAGLTDFDADKVFFGEKFPPDKFPSAFVCPVEAEPTPRTFHTHFWNPTFEIGIVVSNPNQKEGMMDAWKKAWKIAKTLMTDRQLGGLAQDMSTPALIGYWRGLGKGTEQHWVGVVVTVLRQQ